MPTIERRPLEEEHALQFEVVITKEELLSHVETEIKKIAKQGKIRGFRPGHTPMDVVRRMYGNNILKQNFYNILEEELSRFVKEISSSSSPIDLPQPLASDGSLSALSLQNLQAEYRIPFEIGFYPSTVKGLSPYDVYEMIVVDVSDDEAAANLDDIAMRYGVEKEITEGIAIGDTIVVELVELEGDQPKEGGRREESRLLLFPDMPEEIKDAFRGRSVNDVVRVRLSAMKEMMSGLLYRRLLNLSADEDVETIGEWFEATIRNIYRDQPAEMTEAFFQERFGEEVRTQQEALEAIKRATQAFYADFCADRLVKNVMDRLYELNDISWPHRYTKALFAEKRGMSSDDAPEDYDAFLDGLKRLFLLKHLREATGAYPSDEDIVREIAERAYRQLSSMGLEHMLHQLMPSMVQDRKTVEDARTTLIVRMIAAGLPALVTIQERRMPVDEIDNLMQETRANKMKHLQNARQEATEAETPPISAEESLPDKG